MSRPPIIEFTPEGIHCPDGGFHIDPWQPVPRALITHGHADHARAGHGSYLATDLAAPVLRHRLGDITLQTLRYGETQRIGNVDVSFHPAGHVPGSAQIRIARAGEIWVASGDYKIEDDKLSTPFEPVRCHSFITESTFGLPVFRWQPQAEIAAQIAQWWHSTVQGGRTPMLGAYSLGKAQRLISMLDPAQGPILTHGAVSATTDVLRAQGVELPATMHVAPDLAPRDHPGAIVIAPPSAFGTTWARRFGATSSAFASGWMQLRGVRRRRAADRGFVISDHADWNGLNHAVRETGAENIYVTHGYTEVFSRWLGSLGLNTQILPTRFGDDAPPGPDAEIGADAAR